MEFNVEIPEYFICPISLQIMKDPVTAATGITYDRESIEHWLLKGHNTVCPVTKQPLPRDSELTPNHTLFRLIKAWCNSANSAMDSDVDRFPTPKTPLSKSYLDELIRSLRYPGSELQSLQNLQGLAMESEGNRKQMVEGGVAKPIIYFIIQRYRKNNSTAGLAEALNILYLIRSSVSLAKLFLIENNIDEIIEAFSWVLGCDDLNSDGDGDDRGKTIRTHAVFALKIVVQKAKSAHLRKLKPEFFHRLVNYVRERGTEHGINAALQVMLDSIPWGRNRMKMVEAGAPFELIELELKSPEKKTTELILGILFHLCSCADGRAEFLSHAAGIAVVTGRILKLSPTADDRAMLILSLISRFSGTSGVLREMLRVGTVAKLCIVIQSNGETYLKDKAREILRAHSDAWKGSPDCIDLSFLSSHRRGLLIS